MNRIGIFSGTFDPVHSGHISFAIEAMKDCNLDKVVFLPETSPREKEDVTDISLRIEALKKAIGDNENLEVMQLDDEQFTIGETLPKLKDIFKNSSLTLLIGSDIVKTLSYRWKDIDKLFVDLSLAIGMRIGDSEESISATIREVETITKNKINYNFIYTDHMHLASSQIRRTGI